MNHAELEQLLRASYADRKLDRDEKFELRQVAASLSIEQRSFIRNTAFKLVREQITEQQDYQAADGIIDNKWLEQLVKTLDAAAPVAITGAFFSPGEECRRQIIRCIEQARSSIDVCVFTISDNPISAALLAAHQRGISVRILTDNDKSEDRGSDVLALAAAGLPVAMDKSRNHMHHKFAIFDEDQLLNGSFNWTRSATMYNQEDITITDDRSCIAKFQARFDELWALFG